MMPYDEFSRMDIHEQRERMMEMREVGYEHAASEYGRKADKIQAELRVVWQIAAELAAALPTNARQAVGDQYRSYIDSDEMLEVRDLVRILIK